MDSPFYVVWRRGGRSPVFEHASLLFAEAEACRLAKENPGEQFYVLAPTFMARKQDIDMYRYTPNLPPF